MLFVAIGDYMIGVSDMNSLLLNDACAFCHVLPKQIQFVTAGFITMFQCCQLLSFSIVRKSYLIQHLQCFKPFFLNCFDFR